MSTRVSEHQGTDAKFAENQIITWLRDHSQYQSRAISVAIGDQFSCDEELQRWVTQMIYNTLEFSDFPYAIRCSLIELRKSVDESTYDAVDWTVIRAALLPATEESP